MRLLTINPNTTQSMTQTIAVAANAMASADTIIQAVNPSRGPASIQGYYDGAVSTTEVLRLIEQHPDTDGVIIACFDDTGLDAARCLTDKPVVGIGAAAYHMASLVSNKFSVITTLSRSVPILEQNLVRYGLSARCTKVRASDVPVLELENPDSDARQRIGREIEAALNEDGAEAIVLGCAGMTTLAESLSREYGVPVLDGVVCAVSLCESMVRLGLRNSRLGGYTPPGVA